MGIFGNQSVLDELVDRATSENNTREEWGLILEACDRANSDVANGPRALLRAALRRAAHNDPHVALQAAVLLDAAVGNCGRAFHLAVASREFEVEFRKVVGKAQPAVAKRLREYLRSWAENDFKDDSQLALVPALYRSLRQPEDERPSKAPPKVEEERRERDDIARAIELSLKESAVAAASSGGLYPAVHAPLPPPPQVKKVRALYDFEAAEDNELTFTAGEFVYVTDSSDPNWWKGQTDRGEGLFPANFVTSDLSEPQVMMAPSSVSAESEQEWANEAPALDEALLDAALRMLQDASPEGEGEAAAEAQLAAAERQALALQPLIDAALQRADTRHAALAHLGAELVDALNLYHELMRAPQMPPQINYHHQPHC